MSQAPGFRVTVGGDGVDVGNRIVPLRDGGYAVVGYTASRGAGGEDVILIRTAASGDTLWTRTYGGSGDEDGWDLLRRPEGGFVISGFGNSWGAGGDDIILLGDTRISRSFEIDAGIASQNIMLGPRLSICPMTGPT